MCSEPRVSVIIPTYNCARFLAQSVNSVLSQTLDDYEIIVVNDGSTDNTEEVLAPFRSRITYIYQINKGLPAALNAGIKMAKGELLAFLDSDDVWHADKLAKQVELMDRVKEASLCFTNFTPFGDKANYKTGFDEQNGSLICYPRQAIGADCYLITSTSLLKDLLIYQGTPKPSSVMIRRECIEKVGFFNEALTFCQDTQMFLRIAKYFPFVYLDQCLLYRRVRSDSLGTVQSDRRYVLEHIHMCDTLQQWIPLSKEERKALNRILAGYRLAAGYLDFSDYRLSSSREHLWKSVKACFTAKSMFYLLLTALPVNVLKALRFLKQQVVGPISPGRDFPTDLQSATVGKPASRQEK
jgi:glycosyltransferase involved in cell wall biosynthesis